VQLTNIAAQDLPVTPSAGPMPVDQSTALSEFARACKSAARSVGLYPGTHPSIAVALSRVTAAGKRLTTHGDVAIGVHPDMLVIDGRVPARADAAIGELAALLHDRLVGEFRVARGAEAEDWHALLLIVSRTPEELIHDGGIAKAWAESGRSHLEIREIDYAEVLRERGGGAEAAWDHIIACCLHGESPSLDEQALTALVSAIGDSERFGELLARLQASPAAGGAGMAATAAALVQLVSTAVETAIARGCDPDRTLDTAATAMARLTPEMLLGVLAAGQSEGPDSAVAASVIGRMTDDTIASFVANSVAVDRGATERLAHAFEALVPELQRKEQLLELAQDKARATELGKDASFDNLWQTAADMLTSYSDKKYVSDDYGRELSGARTRAVEVERVADDPPERVRQWLDTISETALTQLELQLLLDILRIEDEPTCWAPLAAIAAAEIEHRTRLGALDAAASLVSAIVREQQPHGRPQLATAASQIAETLSSGSLIRHLAAQLRTADEHGVALVAQICHALGATAVRPLAEALAHEENSRAIRALRDILLGFGAVGRNCVEQLKTSTNPAVRRTAIDLLRVFGGDNALSELAAMLDDPDQQVQREAVRAVVQIGTDAANAVLRPRLVASGASRDVLVQLLISLRDDKVIPPLCHVLANTTPSGALAGTHLQIIEALGALHAHPESTRTLQAVLHRGSWWAPARTAMLRRAAAAALMRIGSTDTVAVVEEAARAGGRGVRQIARASLASGPRRDRERA
jgi:hypothetical protein